MKIIWDFFKRNISRICIWVAALVVTIPTGLWCGSKTWHGLNAFFSAYTHIEQLLVLTVSVIVTFAVVILMQLVVKELIKKCSDVV